MTSGDAVAEHDREAALAMGITLAIAWFVLAGIVALRSAWLIVGVDVLAGIVTLAIWMWARARPANVDIAAHGIAATAALTTLTLAMTTGQSESNTVWQLPLIPLLAGSLLGSRGIAVWTVPAALAMAFVFVSERIFDIAPSSVPSATQRSINGMATTALALGYVMYTRGVARRHLRVASEREQTIASQAELLQKAHDEIVQARDEAVNALKDKSEFLATLSHELRAPLNGLIGLSGVLLESKMTKEQAELVQTLHQSATSMRKILSDVLDLSRIESGKLEIRDEPSDVRDLIGEVLDVFAPGAAAKGLELAAIVDPDVPAVLRVDPMRFGQVLTNLVNNALKFTSQGEIVVELTGERELELSVRDTGAGIAPEERERLFRPFEQTSSAEASREIGSGLGLWITQRIVEAMGGTIGVESEVGKGSRFFVRWTAKAADRAQRDSSLIVRAGAKVLAVEDHEASARALESMGPALGIDIAVARSLAQVTEILPGIDEPHVVLVDATLAGATPQAAGEALRALPGLRRLPLVAAVPPSAERVSSGLERPFVATTLKPYRMSRLLALLNDVLSPRPAMPTPVMLAPWRPLDVLVVDDDSTNRLVATLLLERAGLRPHGSPSGEDALALMKTRRFDVVMLDLHMHGIDGVATAKRIRAELDPEKKLWIVALTASVYEDDRQRCLDAGMDDFVPKPIEIGQFRAALERAQRGVRRRTMMPGGTPQVAGGVSPNVLEGLFDALGKDTGELALLIDDYVRSSGELCASLRDAVAKRDLKGAERAAHTLASSSGQLGAHRLEAMARSIEHGGALPDAVALDAIDREREHAIVRMNEWLAAKMT